MALWTVKTRKRINGGFGGEKVYRVKADSAADAMRAVEKAAGITSKTHGIRTA